MSSHDGTASARYESLTTQRNSYLRRARDVARLTIPGIMPEEGSSGSTDLDTPFQSIGARGVNNLSAKPLLALFPPGSSFFRLTLDEALVSELGAETDKEDLRTDIEARLVGIENAVNQRLNSTNSRTILASVLRHLVVAGNCLLEVRKGGVLKMHPLSDYVIQRDLEGVPLEMVIREQLSPLNLPENVKEIVERVTQEVKDKDKSPDDTIALYTRISRSQENWTVHQEVLDEVVDGTEGTFPLDAPSHFPLRWSAVDGESYGRGLGEEYLGDLASVESLSQSMIEFAAVASKILFMVAEGGVTNKEDLEKAANGAIVEGDARDVTVLQVEKFADFQVVDTVAQRIEARLEQAFLLNSSVQRSGERVTAEEIRFMAGELEGALGGTYSTLAAELQRPLVIRMMAQMTKEQKLPRLPKDTVAPQIVTGLEGLGRQGDLLKLDVPLQGIGQNFSPEAITDYVPVGAYVKRRAAALGIDPEGFIRTDEEVAAIREQRSQARQAEEVVGPSIKAATDVALAQSQPQES